MRPKTIRLLLNSLVALACMTTPLHASLLPEKETCKFATEARLNEPFRMSGMNNARTELLAIQIMKPGLLGLEVSAPGTEKTDPALFFLGEKCLVSGQLMKPQPKGFEILEQAAHSYLIDIRSPGTYFVRIAASNPSSALGDIKFKNRFIEQDRSSTELPNLAKDDDFEIDEWDEEILSGNLMSPKPINSRLIARQTFCNSELGEDANEFIWCATPVALGQSIHGELLSSWGDDAEYFTFTLDQTQVIRIRTSGSANTLGTIYDSLGNRLAPLERGEEGADFDLVKILAAGRYVVRIEGLHRSEGSYLLAISPEPRLIE